MKNLIIGIVLGAVGFAGYTYYAPEHKSGNVITQGIVSSVSTDALVAVGPQNATTLVSRASNCTSRVISTASTSVMLSFISSLTPTAVYGHPQAASTTVAYDNATYGCGAITAWASASSTVTVGTFIQ